jgi:hypothetical protein
LQLWPEVTHCQFMQGVQSCCFHQAAAALPYSYNSVWSAPLPVRWGNLVFGTVFSPMRLAQGSTTSSTLGCRLVASPMLSAFVASAHLCSVLVWPQWEVGWHPRTTLNLCYLSCLCSLRVWLLAPSPFSRVDATFYPIPAVGDKLQFTLYAFQFCCGGGNSICPEAVLDYVSRE